MAPPIPRAELTLTYPVYTSCFDPCNDAYLLVGGGGGEGRSGVGNKITLIDTKKPTKLDEVHDIDLSRDEDSVTSLAIARSTETGATAFAGINSSSRELAKGLNEHLRSFSLKYPEERKQETSSGAEDEKRAQKALYSPTPLGKVALFNDAVGKQETYQRVLRLSPPLEGVPRLAAITSGLAPFGEVVVFDASKDTPTKSDVRKQITLQKGEEAADVDLLPSKSGQFELVYCTDYDVCLCTVSAIGDVSDAAPRTLYTTPHPDAFASKKRPTFRAVRFLTEKLLALVLNLPGRTGAEVLLMEIPNERARGGKIVLRKRLHRDIKAGTSFATAYLPAAAKGPNIQHVLAIAGQDISITILTLDHPINSQRLLKLKKFAFLKAVHAVQMTSLAFSHFTQPEDPRTAGPQYLKLASTSMGNTVVVHRFPLMMYPPWFKEPARYCLSSPAGRAEVGQIGISILITIIMAAIGGVLIQALTEIRGGSPEYLGAKNWLGESLRAKIAVPYMFAEAPVVVSSMPTIESVRVKATKSVKSVVSEASKSASTPLPDMEELIAPLPEPIKQAILDYHSPDSEQKPLIFRDTEAGVAAENHHDVEHLAKHGRKWEDLEHHEQNAWKKKLASAGRWTGGQLETLLQGVFFGELGGAVAGAVN